MTITSVDVMSYPMSNGLNSWDDSGGSPDIYLSINPGQTADTNHFVSGAINDVTSSTFTLSQGFPFTIDSLDKEWSIALWDKDDTGDDFMAAIEFQPNAFVKNIPASFSLFGANVEVIANVTWNY